MRPKTDNGSVRTEGKTEKGKNGFCLLLSKLRTIYFDQTSLVCMGCMRFCPACSICPLKAVGAGELQQGRAGKTGAAAVYKH